MKLFKKYDEMTIAELEKKYKNEKSTTKFITALAFIAIASIFIASMMATTFSLSLLMAYVSILMLAVVAQGNIERQIRNEIKFRILAMQIQNEEVTQTQ